MLSSSDAGSANAAVPVGPAKCVVTWEYSTTPVFIFLFLFPSSLPVSRIIHILRLRDPNRGQSNTQSEEEQ